MGQSDQRNSGNRMRAPIVSVDDINFGFLNPVANSERRAKIPVSAHCQWLSRETCCLRALEEW
jgi:hypothetical protein